MRIRVLPRPGSALIAALLAASPLSAPPARAAAARPSVVVVRATGPIRVDGRLDEPDWERAVPLRDFRLIFVREGEVPPDSTELRVLFDDRHIYFGLRCQAHGPGGVRASLAPRDQVLNDDFVALHLDTYRDFHRAYMFGVNPYGVQIDGILDGGDVNLDWDGVWDAETRRDSSGWTAEIAIPLRTLRFPRGGPGAWGCGCAARSRATTRSARGRCGARRSRATSCSRPRISPGSRGSRAAEGSRSSPTSPG